MSEAGLRPVMFRCNRCPEVWANEALDTIEEHPPPPPGWSFYGVFGLFENRGLYFCPQCQTPVTQAVQRAARNVTLKTTP